MHCASTSSDRLFQLGGKIVKEFELKEGMALEEHEDELALTPNDASEIDKFNAFLDALKTNMFWQLKTREEQCMLMQKCYDGVYNCERS